jgi:hypothetical protein
MAPGKASSDVRNKPARIQPSLTPSRPKNPIIEPFASGAREEERWQS